MSASQQEVPLRNSFSSDFNKLMRESEQASYSVEKIIDRAS
jgi:hypothetical protein